MIWETIKIRAKTHGDKTAIICRDKSYTYKELIDSVEKLSAILSTAMLPGDKEVLDISKKLSVHMKKNSTIIDMSSTKVTTAQKVYTLLKKNKIICLTLVFTTLDNYKK